MPLGLLNRATSPDPLAELLTTPPPAKVNTVPNKLRGVPWIAPPFKLGIATPLVTVKLSEEFAVIPAVVAVAGVVTVIGPLVTPGGTITASDVPVASTDEAATIEAPLNLTMLFAAMGSKFVPLMVTPVPAAPLNGEKLVIVGVVPAVGVMLKVWAEIAVPPGVVTVIFPLEALGTVTVREVAVA